MDAQRWHWEMVQRQQQWAAMQAFEAARAAELEASRAEMQRLGALCQLSALDTTGFRVTCAVQAVGRCVTCGSTFCQSHQSIPPSPTLCSGCQAAIERAEAQRQQREQERLEAERRQRLEQARQEEQRHQQRTIAHQAKRTPSAAERAQRRSDELRSLLRRKTRIYPGTILWAPALGFLCFTPILGPLFHRPGRSAAVFYILGQVIGLLAWGGFVAHRLRVRAQMPALKDELTALNYADGCGDRRCQRCYSHALDHL